MRSAAIVSVGSVPPVSRASRPSRRARSVRIGHLQLDALFFLSLASLQNPRALECHTAVLRTAESPVEEAQVVDGFLVGCVQHTGSFQGDGGQRIGAKARLHAAHTIPVPGFGGCEPASRRVLLESLLGLVLVEQHRSQEASGLVIPGVDLQGVAEGAFRLFEAAQVVVDDAGIEVEYGVARVDVQGGGETFEGPGPVARIGRHDGHAMMRFGQGRVTIDSALEGLPGAVESSRAQVQGSQRLVAQGILGMRLDQSPQLRFRTIAMSSLEGDDGLPNRLQLGPIRHRRAHNSYQAEEGQPQHTTLYFLKIQATTVDGVNGVP